MGRVPALHGCLRLHRDANVLYIRARPPPPDEDQVGKFVTSSSIPREKLFVTTKTFSKGASAKNTIESSLKKSGLEYWDLVLIHAPDGGKEARLSAWKALSELVKEGKVKSLGVSNYGEHHIKELLDSQPDVVPVTNQVSRAGEYEPTTFTDCFNSTRLQIECHPFFPQVSLRRYCESHNIPVQSYCPLARQEHFSNSTLQGIASELSKTPAQVMLRWAVQSGLVPLPKSSNEQRQRENADALVGGWELSDEQMRQLDDLGRDGGRAVEIQTMSQDAP